MKSIIFNIGTDMYARTSGGHRIAHELRNHNWDVEVVDFVLYWSFEELKNFFLTRYSNDIKWVGFSFLFNKDHYTIRSFINWIKITYSEITIIVGSNALPSYVNKDVDYYVYGYGEKSTIVLLKWLFSNGEPPVVSLINDQKIIFSNDIYQSAPLKDATIIYQDRDFIKETEWLAIEFSRGCKFKCDFCNFPLLGVKGDYTRSRESFELQLNNAYDRFGITQYIVTDETFNDSTTKIKKFADSVETLNFKPYFSGFVRADLLASRIEDREHLLRMNFLGHYYGIESFNHSSGKSVGKGLSPDKIKNELLNCKQYFNQHGGWYRGDISLIIGLPHETVETLTESKKWLIDNWSDESFTAFPLLILKPEHDLNKISKFSNDYKKYGYSEIKDISNLSSFYKNISDYQVLWENKHMNIIDAHNIYEDFLRIYDDVKIGAFNLSSMAFPTSLNDRLKIKNVESKKYKKNYINFISQYKNSKINLS
jgi:radical SAM superfamily enzyme YgiQ (UPF0313 family)